MTRRSAGAREEAAGDRRITACLRACEGIPTEELERDIILNLVAACIHVEDSRVREVLERLTVLRRRLGGPGRSEGAAQTGSGSPACAECGTPLRRSQTTALCNMCSWSRGKKRVQAFEQRPKPTSA